MSKKAIGWSVIFMLTAVIVGTGAFLAVVMNDQKQEEADIKAVSTEGVHAKQVSYGVVQHYLDLAPGASQDEVIEAMHRMTHQKVKANAVRGAIPMTVTAIDELYRVIQMNDYERKDDLLEIAGRWKRNDFSHIVKDHNYLWEYQGKGDGKAYGALSKAEEKAFVEVNFGEHSERLLKGM
ncbi:DUF6241 domain-containing protein [Domibacillus indicus]|uniref:DUF6241 domain-containing protein n=1 Tax=Domibacillus indicus TaxID=1437523 RepID=UPI0006990581|nr:DUF6241 domain-containing protein [Domibacillus indicus]